MGRFAGLSGIRTNQGGVYFLPGDYVVDIQAIKFFTNRKGQDTFVIEAKVVESTNEKREPGCVPSQVIVFREDILSTIMGNIKQFVGALLEIKDPDAYEEMPDLRIPGDTVEAATDRFWEQAIESLVSDAQPAKNMRIHLNVTNIKTKAEKDFGKHVWGPLVSMPAA
jgi:hypothetical protein